MNVLLVNGSPHEQGCTDAAGADIAPGQESVVTTTG